MFRPCIDLHEGKVKQIVGPSLTTTRSELKENFVATQPASHFAALYKQDALTGGHVIMLGSGNEHAALDALSAYPGGLQIGGGITLENARKWLDAQASHIIVTSWLFPQNELDWTRLEQLVHAVGRQRLVLDLSCRRRDNHYYVVSNRWQHFTRLQLSRDALGKLGGFCAEFLIHAVDVEGQRLGIDRELVEKLADWCDIPTTYAGGAKSLQDLEDVTRIGRGKIDLTIGSALDIFGGSEVRYRDAVEFNRRSAPY
ncbi:MAG: phosphoribosylformimino-5-aminoimidazole carboxamide ribotide isomerase [Verrucomicrobiota bacterium]|jgi:phosphoribosylformimino-5-aminoimidazole carboxamide ribotide isomerase